MKTFRLNIMHNIRKVINFQFSRFPWCRAHETAKRKEETCTIFRRAYVPIIPSVLTIPVTSIASFHNDVIHLEKQKLSQDFPMLITKDFNFRHVTFRASFSLNLSSSRSRVFLREKIPESEKLFHSTLSLFRDFHRVARFKSKVKWFSFGKEENQEKIYERKC